MHFLGLQNSPFDFNESFSSISKCHFKDPHANEQWIYNKVSWQIVPRSNQSMCVQKLFNGYNAGTPIVLKPCHRHQTQACLRYVDLISDFVKRSYYVIVLQ